MSVFFSKEEYREYYEIIRTAVLIAPHYSVTTLFIRSENRIFVYFFITQVTLLGNLRRKYL